MVKPPNRTANTQVNIRLTREQVELLEQAAIATPYARPSLATFLPVSGLEAAEKLTGKAKGR